MSVYGDRTYRKRREALRRKAMRLGIPCHLCDEPIDFEVDRKHPRSFEADHVKAIAAGGKLLGELRPAHLSQVLQR